ncbi:MAG: hypothetical protein JW395_4126 [Nitrospira sp.]|nr:hypothetical protein [Nitrospira sp.]
MNDRPADKARTRFHSDSRAGCVCLIWSVWFVWSLWFVLFIELVSSNQTNETNQRDQTTIFGCGLTSFYWELFHEFFGKERGLEHPTHAGQHLPVYP